MKSYIVIGLGRFGTEMAVKLYDCGEDVLAIDTNDTLIDKIADRVTRAVAADARDVDVLRKLGAGNYDRAIVAVGSDLGASALITMNLKTLGVPYIMCKAHDDTYREILEKLGADRVIIPEWEMADKLSLGLTSAGVLEYIELSEEYGIVEMATPASWAGKSIRKLALRHFCFMQLFQQLRAGDRQFLQAFRVLPDAFRHGGGVQHLIDGSIALAAAHSPRVCF